MTSYQITRHFQRDWQSETILTDLTLEEAQEHCSDPETSSSTCEEEDGLALTRERGNWFDGYTEE